MSAPSQKLTTFTRGRPRCVANLVLQSSEYVKAHGQLDLIVEPGEGQDSQEAVEDRLQSIVSMLFSGDASAAAPVSKETSVPATKEDMEVCCY